MGSNPGSQGTAGQCSGTVDTMFMLRRKQKQEKGEYETSTQTRKTELEFNPSGSEVTVITLQTIGNFKVCTMIAHKQLDDCFHNSSAKYKVTHGAVGVTFLWRLAYVLCCTVSTAP